MNKIKNTKGITLVALVITVIILLILAGITVATLTGENGLFTRVKQAKQNTIDAQEQENLALSDYETQIDDIVGNKKEVEETDIYVKLYEDGTLTFSSSKDKLVDGKDISDVSNEYNKENIKGKIYTNTTDNAPLWYSDRASIKSVVVLDEIVPISTARWFQNCENLVSVDLKKLNTSKVIDMNRMFMSCSNLENIDVSKFNTSSVIDMADMFSCCTNLTSLDVSQFNTSKVTDMEDMFDSCINLTSLDVSKFNTSSVTNIAGMFWGCKNLNSLNLSSFDTSKVTNMSGMFDGCKNLNSLDLSSFDTSKVTDMENMFDSCINLTSLDLSSFDTSKVTNMYRMFYNCSNLTKIEVSSKWVTTNVTLNTDMFTGCGTSQVTIK